MSRPQISQSEKGTAAVESTLAISVLVPILIGGFCAIYFSFARVWVERSSYEALICLSTQASQQSCEQGFRKNIDAALPIGTLSDLRFNRSRKQVDIDLRFKIGSYNAIHHRASQSLPLQIGSRL